MTKIIVEHLQDHNKASVAQKLSWASERETTRIEDEAYSLLGLFDVNMPLLYGEGPKAFRRLQHEIIRSSDDHSIFAWTGPGTGVLAASPSDFRTSGNIVPLNFDHSLELYTISLAGLSIHLNYINCQHNEGAENQIMATPNGEVESIQSYGGILNCIREDTEQWCVLWLEFDIQADTLAEAPLRVRRINESTFFERSKLDSQLLGSRRFFILSGVSPKADRKVKMRKALDSGLLIVNFPMHGNGHEGLTIGGGDICAIQHISGSKNQVCMRVTTSGFPDPACLLLKDPNSLKRIVVRWYGALVMANEPMLEVDVWSREAFEAQEEASLVFYEPDSCEELVLQKGLYLWVALTRGKVSTPADDGYVSSKWILALEVTRSSRSVLLARSEWPLLSS